MRVYKVQMPKTAFPVGVVIEHGKVTQAHPLVGDVVGKSIEYVKERVARKNGTITRVRDSRRAKK